MQVAIYMIHHDSCFIKSNQNLLAPPPDTMNFPKYDHYKDSSVEWLGEVPGHWEVKRNLGVFDERNERGRPDDELLSVTINRGVICQSEITTKKDSSNEDKSKYKVLKAGDLAYNKMRAWQGALGISPYDGIVSPAYIILKPKNPKLSKYFHYLYRTPLFIAEANRLSYGLCDDMNSLRYEDFKGSYSPLPPDEEVDRIVAFLDVKTAQIDALIAKKERQIELLEEQKAIRINQAVTRGLNPDVKLKPSGIEWIGEIPEHWEVKKLKYTAKGVWTGRTPSTVDTSEALPGGVTWYTPGDYNKSGFLLESARKAQNTRLESVETYPPNSIFFIGIGATLGNVNISTRPAGCNQQINVIEIKDTENSPEYFLRLLDTAREYVFHSSDYTTLPIINRSKTGALMIICPPHDEQDEISSRCMAIIHDFAAVSENILSQIQSLKTLRSTLIAHAVTGKIKV